MKSLFVLSLTGLFFIGAKAEDLFDMDEIRDPSTLEIQVLKEWHHVDGRVPTRQKTIAIRVGEIWEGQDYRVPVRMIVPADRKAKGFHLTGGNTPDRLKNEARISDFDRTLLERGVGLVQTVVQEPRAMGLMELGRESEVRFLASLDPQVKVQYWAWPATMMRAITAALAEPEHFEPGGKVAMSGGSKNGATPSMAILHDERMTAVHGSVSPIWDSPLRLCDVDAWARLKAEAGDFRHPFLGGHYGPIFNRQALEAGRTWEELVEFTASISDDVFISRNLPELRERNVELLFHPGTHDFVCFDLAWGGGHFPDIPIYLGANSGHGIKGGHPARERNEQNKAAFLLRHFFPDQVDPLLTPPQVMSKIVEDQLEVTVSFPPSSRATWLTGCPLLQSSSAVSVRNSSV